MIERVDARRGDVRVLRQIAERVEAGRVTARLQTELLIVIERVHARSRDIGVVRQIDGVTGRPLGKPLARYGAEW